jgi:flagellar motor switch protein FliG
MEIKLNIGYEQLIAIINQLSIDEVNKLKAEIEKISNERKVEAVDDLESLIADGPVMNEKKYQEFEENRKNFSQWRAS